MEFLPEAGVSIVSVSAWAEVEIVQLPDWISAGVVEVGATPRLQSFGFKFQSPTPFQRSVVIALSNASD